jgi:hypothetical protein
MWVKRTEKFDWTVIKGKKERKKRKQKQKKEGTR